jgi:hypothetical protein
MKIIQSFWTGHSAIEKKDLFWNMGAGWPSAEYHWMSWTLSCLRLRDVFGFVHLVTDQKGAEILVNNLQLPYETVDLALEKKMDTYPANLWALAKIHAYQIQDEPFLHADSDVFLWEKPPLALLKADVIAQNKERNILLYLEALDYIDQYFSFLPFYTKKNFYEKKDLDAANVGLFGGNNMAFIKKYCQQAFDLIDLNINAFQKLAPPIYLNHIAEQYLLYHLSKKEKVPIKYLMKQVVEDPIYSEYVQFENIPYVKIIHPVGAHKLTQNAYNHIAKRLRYEYPDYYYRIIKLFNDRNKNTHPKIYTVFSPVVENVIHSSASKRNVSIDSRKKSNTTEGFKFTRSLIRYYKTRRKIKSIRIADIEKSKMNLISKIKQEKLSSKERKMLLELYAIESCQQQMFKKYFSNASTLKKMYEYDVSHYSSIQAVFSGPDKYNESATIRINPYVRLLKVHWMWRDSTSCKIIDQQIKENQHQAPAAARMVLIPTVLSVTINFYHLDELDVEIIKAVGKGATIAAVLKKLTKQFSLDTKKQNRTELHTRNLVLIDIFKILIHAGVLVV